MGHKNKYNKNVDEHVYLIDFFYSSIKRIVKKSYVIIEKSFMIHILIKLFELILLVLFFRKEIIN